MAILNIEDESYKIKFRDNTHSWLAYGISSSGVNLHLYGDTQVSIQVYNSRDKLTPGYIHIPLEAIPELINDLQELYGRNQHKLIEARPGI